MDSYQNESTAAAASPAVDYSARRRAMLLGSGIAGVLLIAATQVPSARLTGTTALSIPSKNGVGPMKYRKSQGKYPPSGIYGELLGDDQIQKNWPGLTCERSDDDKWEWGNSAVQKDQSGTNCLWGDTDYCLDMMENPSWRKNNVAWNMCNSTCNYTDVDLVSRETRPNLARGPICVPCSHPATLPPSRPGASARARVQLENSYNMSNISLNGVQLHGTSYLAVCEWEAIKKMPEICNGGFVPTVPSNSSNNNGPSVPDRNDTTIYINNTYQYAACNVHAMCYVCVDEDESINKYCAAVLLHYDYRKRDYSSLHSISAATSLFWDNTPYWCQAEVLEAIGTGHYKEKLEAGVLGNWNPHAKGGWPNDDHDEPTDESVNR